MVQVNLTRHCDVDAIGWDVDKNVVPKLNMAIHTKVPGRSGEAREDVVDDISFFRQTPNQKLWQGIFRGDLERSYYFVKVINELGYNVIVRCESDNLSKSLFDICLII